MDIELFLAGGLDLFLGLMMILVMVKSKTKFEHTDKRLGLVYASASFILVVWGVTFMIVAYSGIVPFG